MRKDKSVYVRGENMAEEKNIEKLFGANVFSIGKMKKYLSRNVYKEVKYLRDFGGELSPSTADVVAKAMKKWAVEKGAAHYTHWFQPLTGITAEKHDSFVTHPNMDGKMLMEFSGKQLVKGESDASSFPSGGLRATFEARGYTTWDVTSPAFIKEGSTGPILCIPTTFCSYTGEALDKKTPLLRSMEAVGQQALRIVRLFGNTEAKNITALVGAEQEYFLIDREKYLQRSDLVFSGRTLFGASPPKRQELEDHYFGAIRERVGSFMRDVNIELWKLGVTAKTQHNETAPAQHELVPIYETANIAVDHNQIVMETLKKVASRHGLACLLHEKPFDGVNGSGKHDNWSITTDSGVNLMDPGKTPNDNVQFLLILSCVLKAIDIHADLLRQSAADVGNDHRLGAAEAPPAVVSVFLGTQLEDVVKQLVETGMAETCLGNRRLETGVSTIPDIEMDATDRNRTSPFAFTGNKFEFRMVGSSDSIASPNTTLNAIFAEAFCEAADELEKAEDFDLAVHDLIKKYLSEHKRIIFNGDGYSPDWIKEAECRGLPNLRTTIDAAETLTKDKAIHLFERFKIYTRKELESREEIVYETYAKTISIEVNSMVEMASKQLIPAGLKYQKLLVDTVNALKNAGNDSITAQKQLRSVSQNLDAMQNALEELIEERENKVKIKEARKQAFFSRDVLQNKMLALREPADRLEMLVDKEMWPIPCYADLLFEV